MTLIDRIDHVVINCHDVETTASWYVMALGFQRETYGDKNRTALKFGNQKFNVRQTGDAGWRTCSTDAPGSLDMCFITDGPIEHVLARWKACGVEVTNGPIAMDGALGPMTSVYCRDPDGNLIEVASYG